MHDVEHAVVREEPVGHEGMDMAIVPHVLVPQSRDLDGHDHAELPGWAIEAAAQEFEQTLVGNPAKIPRYASRPGCKHFRSWRLFRK